MPYESNDLSIHLLHCLIQIIFISSHMTLEACFLSIFFSFFGFVKAMCEDFRHIFDSIDEKLTANEFNGSTPLMSMFLDAYKFEEEIIK